MAMSVRVGFTTQKLQEMTNKSRRQIQAIRSEIDQAIGQELKKCVQEEFDKLSRRGSGADGRKWFDITPETKQRKGSSLIGVRTGHLKNSLTTAVNNRGVRVEYVASYAQYFDEHRKLMPDKLPLTWENRLSKVAQKIVNQRMR